MNQYREKIETNELFLEIATWEGFETAEDLLAECRLELEAIRTEMLTVSED